jgi:hypothetical protein
MNAYGEEDAILCVKKQSVMKRGFPLVLKMGAVLSRHVEI